MRCVNCGAVLTGYIHYCYYSPSWEYPSTNPYPYEVTY